MDMRLENLEFRALRMERVVEKLCHAVPDFQAPTDLKEPSRPSSSRRWLETDTKLKIPFPDIPPHPSGSLRPPSSPTANAASPLRSAFRPTSTSTMRGALSLPTLNREPGQAGAATPQAEVISQLRSDLDAERAARAALEAQVKKLSDRVNTLSTTMFAMIRSPSESRSNERLAASAAAAAPPASAVGGSAVSLLQSPKTLLVPPPRRPRQEQLSVFETDDDDDDEPKRKRDLDEEGEATEDDFQTPREERTPLVSYGAFGPGGLRVPGHDDDDDTEGGGASGEDDDPKRKKAARTLSLGQLTLGKGQRARV
jgi:hypothetical protein